MAQMYRVLRMEPLVGEDRPDARTQDTPGIEGSAAGPTMQAAREFEGQTVRLDELTGMGQFRWEGDGVARLDTASESYRIELEPVARSAEE
ncbi:MAG: hypothetical protein IT305_11650 [Chloroflexi bacterium]|nr:hypothetical protein [Chloroflexota bacterium]